MTKFLLKPYRTLSSLGFVSLAGYAAAALGLRATSRTGDVFAFLALFGGLFLVYFGALFWIRNSNLKNDKVSPQGDKALFVHILVWAFLFRLALVPAGLPAGSRLAALGADLTASEVGYNTYLLYDNDVWRYLWDGHVLASGLDPYAQSPHQLGERFDAGDPVAEALFEDDVWYDVHDNVYYKHYKTVYPPLAQLLFALLHAAVPASVFALKLALAAFDFGTCLVLAGLVRRLGASPAVVLAYAWNPLAVKEIAGSGHVDAMMVFFLVLAVDLVVRGRRRLGLVAYALAILSKLTPVLLLPLFLRRTRAVEWPLVPLVGLAAYLPFVSSWFDVLRAIRDFSSEWVFNPGPWALWKGLAEGAGFEDGRAVADPLTLALTLGLVAWVVWKDDAGDRDLVSGTGLVLGAYVVLSATVMPWYLIWALPFLAFTRFAPAWIALTALSLLSYLIYIDQVEHSWWLWTEFLLFFLILILTLTRQSAGKPTLTRSS